MARKTNKEMVLTLAADLGIEVEYGVMGSEGFEVALYGYAAHMAIDPFGEGHTSIHNQAGTGARTEARIWGMALEDLRQYVPCEPSCHCHGDAATHTHNLTGKHDAADADMTPCAELPHCPSVCDCPPGGCTALAAPVAAPAYVVHGDYYAPGTDIDGDDPEVLTHYAVAAADTETEARELVADLTVTNPTVDWYYVPVDADVTARVSKLVGVPEPEPAPVVKTVMTRYYLIADHDTGEEHTGSVIGNCDPVEAMRTMVGIVKNVPRDTVALVPTNDGPGGWWWVESGQRYGTARFLSAVESPVNPYR